MNQQEFIDQVQASPLSDSTKKEILSLIESQGFNFDTREEIKDIIQSEIDADFADVLEPEDMSEVETKTAELSQDLKQIENDLDTNMKFVESQLSGLTTMIQDLDKVQEEMQIDAIKAKIG